MRDAPFFKGSAPRGNLTSATKRKQEEEGAGGLDKSRSLGSLRLRRKATPGSGRRKAVRALLTGARRKAEALRGGGRGAGHAASAPSIAQQMGRGGGAQRHKPGVFGKPKDKRYSHNLKKRFDIKPDMLEAIVGQRRSGRPKYMTIHT